MVQRKEKTNRLSLVLTVIVYAAAVVYVAVFVYRGRMLGDEGWYCMAAEQVLSGRM